MAGGGTLCAVLMAVAGGPAGALPVESADVVTVKLNRHSLADGLENYSVDLTAAKGWHVVANVEGMDDRRDRPKPPEGAATLVEFLADGKRAFTHSSYYYKGVVKKDSAGREYPTWEKNGGFSSWVSWEDTMNAKVVSVRVRVVASNGKMRLKESVVTAEVR
jgi:hypothetical protein